MQITENPGEKQNKCKLCNACQWWPAAKDSNFCESCGPLIKEFVRQLRKPYGNKNNKR